MAYLDQTLGAARAMMDDLLEPLDGEGLQPGDLVRTTPAVIGVPPVAAASHLEDTIDRKDSHRVLVVDDAEDLRMLLRARMETRNGLTVVGEAADGLAAVELASELQPDLVMLDLAMPRMDGLEALPLIRAAVPGVRVIVLSGFNQSSLAEKALEAGADQYVVKGGSMRAAARARRDGPRRGFLSVPRPRPWVRSDHEWRPAAARGHPGRPRGRDVLDEGYSPPEREPDHLRHPEGGESLEDRLDEEQPEVWARAEEEADADIVDGDVGGEVGAGRSGRLLAPDEGSHEDVDAELVAEDEGIDGAGASAEEAAVHTIEDE